MNPIEKYKPFPYLTIKAVDGADVDLGSFKQRSHVVLVVDRSMTAARAAEIQAQIAAARQKWDWLNAAFVFSSAPAEGLEPAVYVIDRYTRLWNILPLQGWTLEQLEQDLIYYEARHC